MSRMAALPLMITTFWTAGIMTTLSVGRSAAIGEVVIIGVRLLGRLPEIQDPCHNESLKFAAISCVWHQGPTRQMEMTTKSSIELAAQLDVFGVQDQLQAM